MARWIALAIFGGLGAMLLVVGVRELLRQRRLLANAVPVAAVVTHSAVRASRSGTVDRRPGRDTSTTTHRPDVRFAYEIAGRRYESDQLRASAIARSYASAAAAADELEPYPVGASVVAYVDPAHPERACLVLERSSGPAVFVALGLALPALAWWIGPYL